MPILLARAALAAVEARGPGAKVPRSELFAILAGLERRLDAGARALGPETIDLAPLRGCVQVLP